MATQRQLSNTTYASILSGPKEQEEMNKMLKHLKTSSASASMTTASTSATTATKKAGLERVDSGVEMNVKPEQWRLVRTILNYSLFPIFSKLNIN